jgi:muramoyltetrapeptide carboxypeptidase LdcA involved in peptidoglycan recycling
MFQQLVGSGVLDGVVGLVVGDFTGVSERELDGIGVVIRELADQRGWVCASGLPVGHGARNACLPMGRQVRLEVGVSGRLSVGSGVGARP